MPEKWFFISMFNKEFSFFVNVLGEYAPHKAKNHAFYKGKFIPDGVKTIRLSYAM